MRRRQRYPALPATVRGDHAWLLMAAAYNRQMAFLQSASGGGRWDSQIEKARERLAKARQLRTVQYPLFAAILEPWRQEEIVDAL